MGRIGKAPRPLGLTNKAGVPWVALLFSNGFSCIAFISVSSNAGKLYEALITLSGGKLGLYFVLLAGNIDGTLIQNRPQVR